MRVILLAPVFLAAFAVTGAEPPLPALRVDAVDGGSVFYVRNGYSQPLTSYWIELVNYPGSSYSLLQDDAADPILPGAEKRIPVTNMTVGAVPEYVKLQAAVYADGASAGNAEKIAQIIDRRRAMLETTRDLIRRLEAARSSSVAKPVTISDLKQWASTMQPPSKSERNSPASLNRMAARSLVTGVATRLDVDSYEDVLAELRTSEKRFAASKPPL
jgi:hypothetical protein